MASNVSQNCAIVISTCDDYSDIWDPFFVLFHKFWPDNPYPVFLNSETLEYGNCNISTSTLLARTDKLSWTRRLKEALERINTEYIVFMLDDYFLYDYVDTPRIKECITYMQNDLDISAIYFTYLGGQMKMEECSLPGLEKCSHTGRSKINITLTLWRRVSFLYYLDRDETAWEFEKNAVERSLERSDTFFSFSSNAPIVVPYALTKYGLFSGKWFKPTMDLFREHGIIHDFSVRGFYEDYEFGLIPYVSQKIVMDSYLVPCFSLTRDNPRIDTEIVVEDGEFSQIYNVAGAKYAAIWYPSSSFYGHVIENFKCIIAFNNGTKETMGAEDVFGSFALYRGAMCFLRSGVFVYILPKSKQEMLCINIKGFLSKHFSSGDLAAAYDIAVRETPFGFRGLLNESRVFAETLLVPETFMHFRIYSRLCFNYNSYNDKKTIFDGKDRFPGHFLQSYKTDKIANQTDQLVRWDIGGTFGGFAIECLRIELIYNNVEIRIIDYKNIKGDGLLIDGYWVFLSPLALILFTLPEKCPNEIIISGIVLAPMPRKVLRAVIYADVVDAEASEIKSKYNRSVLNPNGLRFIVYRVKKGIKKYGIVGICREAFRRILHL